MAFKELVDSFNKYNNSDLLLEVAQGNIVEYLVSVEINSSTIPKYAREIVSSYDQSVLANLKDRIFKHLSSLYLQEKQPELIEDSFIVEKIPNGEQNYRRIFYYATFDLTNAEQKIIEVPLDIINTATEDILQLDFEPSEEEKNILMENSIEFPLENFKDWVLCVVEESSESAIKQGINKILELSNKKGTWIVNSDKIKTESKSNLKNVIVVPNTDKKVSDLESDVVLFFDKNNTLDSNSTTEVLFDSTSPYTSISIFYKYYIDTNGISCFLIGFPKTLINQFPDLSYATDIIKFNIDTKVTYDDFSDLEKSIANLKGLITKKKESLEDSGLTISNYDLDFYIKNIEKFISSLQDYFNKQQIDPGSELTFEFYKQPCENLPLTDNPQTNEINNSIYKKCLNEIVDGQTNLVLNKILSNETNEIAVDSFYIDKNLSAYLFTNAKNIVSASDSYTAKNFFLKLIYEKTKFEKKENLDLSTFMSAAETSFQQTFVQDTANFFKFSKIKENIQKNNPNKTISQYIKDVLSDIHNLKQIYETVLYRFDLKDIADDLIKCFLEKNPNLSEGLSEASLFIENLIKLINTKDTDLIKLSSCLGVNIPTSFGEINPNVPPTDIVIEPQVILDEIKSQTLEAVNKASDPDIVLPIIIKCFNEFGGTDIKKIIDTYVTNKEAAKALKQQYDQLVLEAKLYKSNPGARDGLKKKGVSFLTTARRNAWILLQRQAEKEAEKLAKEAAIYLIKKLLNDANACKKDQNKKKDKGKPGDIQVAPNTGSSEIDNLIIDLTKFYSPEQFCSLLYGSADDDLYQSVIEFIKTRYPNLYSEAPIKIGNVIYSQSSLSSIKAVKDFFIKLSIEKKDLQNKCDNYFKSIIESPLNLDDEEKCIDFSQKYIENKIKELSDKGFNKEQIQNILNNEKSLQSAKYKNLQKMMDAGIYNEISAKEENHTYPAADIVKNKINNQLKALSYSFGSFIDSYKQELIQLSYANFKSFLISENNVFYSWLISVLNVKGNAISFKDTKETDFYFSVEPIFKYFSLYENIKYTIEVKSDKYDSLLNYEQANLKEVMKQIFINSAEQNSTKSSLLLFNFKNPNPEYWTQPFSKAIVSYAENIRQQYAIQLSDFQTKEFNKQKMLADVKELIYFEE